MPDFSNLPVVDHHCHPYDPEQAFLEPISLARVFLHGFCDIPKTDPSLKPRYWDASKELNDHFPHMGVVQTLVCRLSGLFGCPADLASVAQERNRRTGDSFRDYIRMLYEDARLVGTVLDTGLPAGDPLLDLIPPRRLRLFQMDPAIPELAALSGSYRDYIDAYGQRLEKAVHRDGFVGVKVHLAERVGLGAEPVPDAEMERVFPEVKTGNAEAGKKLYVATFAATLLRCRDLGVPVHIHTGFTGGLWNGPISGADPFLLAPLLSRKEFLNTRVVLLHAGYPWTKQAGQLAHTLPHVWVDMSQMTPWASLCLAECYRDVMAWAPWSKIVVGSGGHGTPEIAWLAAKTAKIALSTVFTEAVSSGLVTEKQAASAARMILHDNAARLYGLASQ
ncbi:MAG: amidohydrolase family protein [Acidobacteriota bacterium]